MGKKRAQRRGSEAQRIKTEVQEREEKAVQSFLGIRQVESFHRSTNIY